MEEMKNLLAWLKRWGPAILVMAVIFIASSTPGNEIPGFGVWDLIVKKGGHMSGYALLAMGFMHALTVTQKSHRIHFILAVFLAVFYAVTDEFHQAFTPGRTPSAGDVGIDTVGVVLGVLVWIWIKTRLRAQLSAPQSQ
jgi:VanZ family protein